MTRTFLGNDACHLCLELRVTNFKKKFSLFELRNSKPLIKQQALI